MTDSDDKTRVKPDRNATSDKEDATRVSITPGRNTNAADSTNDKTRIAPTPQHQDEKTRIPQKSGAQSAVQQPVHGDQTVIAAAKTLPASGSGKQTAKPMPLIPLQNHAVNSTNEASILSGDYFVLKNRFVLEKVIGTGGMGVVYKAKDLLKVEANDRDPYVAIKVLSDEIKSHPESFIALQRESRKSQRIAHPNIVNVYDFDRDGDTVFMTMEYMDGKPLDKLLQQYKSTGLPSDDAWHILDGMCAALTHAHNEKIIHSDFKPGNVYVTNRGLAKVFDFGIARAVAKVEHQDSHQAEDKTLFDAGTFGGLTPAYASLEMLEGKTPDIRDDIYALGCVAYELFTGEHPFGKIPADEAERRKLKPKKIATLSKRQWRVIEKSLAFRREDRISSVGEFTRQIKYKNKPAYQLAASLAILVALFVVIYFQYFKAEPVGPDTGQMRNELEYEIRLDLHKKNIARLLTDATFTASWESELWSEFQEIKKLLVSSDEWLIQNTNTVFSMYLRKIEESVQSKRFAQTKSLITNAYRYAGDTQLLKQQEELLAAAIQAEEAGNQAVVVQQQVVQQQKIENDIKKKNLDLFELALKNVNQQINCQAGLNIQNVEAAVDKLRSLDLARYNTLEPQIVKPLAACIELIGKTMAERAEAYKADASRIFNNNRIIAAIRIQPRDACDASLAGLGARGQRTVCRDKLQQGDNGPALVVIPGNSSIKMFAMGKYEVSLDELNVFCTATKQCGAKAGDGSLPVTSMSFDIVSSYLKWLSRNTDRKYRLPTKNEWLYAARANNATLDPNRNCKLSTRGIQKGNELVKVITGQQNDWGLVNHVGNAQEWVYDSGSILIAIGGSYEDSMDDCNQQTSKQHTGTADPITGFRVLREMKGEGT